MGNHVNLTSRIESYTIGGQILISETSLRAVGPLLKLAGEMQVEAKGVDRLLTLYDVRGIGRPYDLFLPERQETLVPLREILAVQYTAIEGQHLRGDGFTGSLVKVSDKGGEIIANTPVAPWSNSKLQLTDFSGEVISGDLYAKVTGILPGESNGFSIRFTAVPPEIAQFLQHLLASRPPGGVA